MAYENPTDLAAAIRAVNDGSDTTCNNGESMSAVELAHYARQDAMNTLIENWSAALHDGVSLRRLIGDIDDVVADLNATKSVLERRFEDDLDKVFHGTSGPSGP